MQENKVKKALLSQKNQVEALMTSVKAKKALTKLGKVSVNSNFDDWKQLVENKEMIIVKYQVHVGKIYQKN